MHTPIRPFQQPPLPKEMTKYYHEHDRIYVSVDCIVFGMENGNLKLLLTRRDFQPEKGRWSLMGGFVNSDESVIDSARRVLRDLTGLEGTYMQQVGAFGEVHRDPGARVVSVAFLALVNFGDIDQELIRRHNAVWVDTDNLPDLGFDHPQMISQALGELRRRLLTEPVAFNLLPRTFTLTQLQELYQTILHLPLDKRNFRRRMLESGYIEPTDRIDKSTSKKGARLYCSVKKASPGHAV